MRTIQTSVYNFEDVEANKELLTKVLEKNRFYNVQDSFWYKYTDESFKSILERIGFYDIKLSFSVSYSQGDFAKFTGQFKPRKEGIKEVIEDFATWTELHNVLNILDNVLENSPIEVLGDFNGSWFNVIDSDESLELCNSFENQVNDICKELCKLYYKSVVEAYEYETSNEGLTEYFRNSDLEFLEDGSIF